MVCTVCISISNSVDPDQRVPSEALWSGSTVFDMSISMTLWSWYLQFASTYQTVLILIREFLRDHSGLDLHCLICRLAWPSDHGMYCLHQHIKQCRSWSEGSFGCTLVWIYSVWYVDSHGPLIMVCTVCINISNSVDPDQRIPSGALWSGSTVFDMSISMTLWSWYL